MATRKDSHGRALRKGETQRNDNKYMYSYYDSMGKRRYIYAKDIAKLREREQQLLKDQLDGLDNSAYANCTLDDMFDRYISTKSNLQETTLSGYIYTYERYVRDGFGRRKVKDIKYSDVLKFYLDMMNEQGYSFSIVDSVHCLLHPTFQMAVRDNVIRTNPSDDVKAELSKKLGNKRKKRHALTVEEQEIFMNFVKDSPLFCHWWPILTVLLGTGMRIGECLGLTWDDVDFEARTINVNHSLVYFSEEGVCKFSIHAPKTESGIRIIPMLDSVREALQLIKETQETDGITSPVMGKYKDFIFLNSYGNLVKPPSINLAINRITAACNQESRVKAVKKGVKPVIVPHFSCHVLRHTFCTRLCEVESNLKVIMSIMGHADISTTMEIYAEATERKNKEAFDKLEEKMNKLL